MESKHYLLLLVLFLATSADDSPAKVKKFNFNFSRSASKSLNMTGVLEMSRTALSEGKIVRMELKTIQAPIVFTILLKNRAYVHSDHKYTAHVIVFFDGVMLSSILKEAGKNEETSELLMRMYSSGMTTGSIAFEVVDPIAKVPGEKLDGDFLELEISQENMEKKNNTVYLQEFIDTVLLNNATKSLEVTSQFNVHKLEITFSKCDVNPTTIRFVDQDQFNITSENLEELWFLSHVTCEEDLIEGRLDMTINSPRPDLNGTIKFEVVTRPEDLGPKEDGALYIMVFVVVVGAVLLVCIGVVLVVCCCKKNRTKKTTQVWRQRSEAPIVPENIELQDLASSNVRSKVIYVFDDHCDDETSAAMYAAVPEHVKEAMRTRPPPPFLTRAETSETMNHELNNLQQVPSGSCDRPVSSNTTSENIYEVVRSKKKF